MIAVKLFSSEERLKVLELLLYQPGKELGVREISRAAGVSPALVSSTISILKKANIVSGNKVEYLHPATKAIKIMLNIEKIESIKLIHKARGLFKGCKGIGLYGSWANGTNIKDSDLDLWIRSGSESDEKINEIRRTLKRLGVEANVIVLTEKRLKELKERDFVFYCALHNSFVLWGEGL